jgi:hypothetical protein
MITYGSMHLPKHVNGQDRSSPHKSLASIPVSLAPQYKRGGYAASRKHMYSKKIPKLLKAVFLNHARDLHVLI